MLVLPTLIVGLAATAAFALRHELKTTGRSLPVAGIGEASSPQALGPAEEAYAEALLPIQQAASIAALRMSFAGLAYKTEHSDPQQLRDAVGPLRQQFRTALESAGQVPAPESLRSVRDQYVEALVLYEASAAEMMRFVESGGEEHLIEAQGMSQRASENVLRVGDVLWPAAHKPH